MDPEDNDKDPNAVLEALLSLSSLPSLPSDNSKNVGYTKTVVAEPSVSDVRIVNVYNEGVTVHYTADASTLQQTVDFETLQWQNIDRNAYAVGDTLLWEGTVQVDQIDNLHSLGVLETASVSTDGELKKTEIYSDVPVSITNSLQNTVLTLDNIPTLSSTSTVDESCIPSTPHISIDSTPHISIDSPPPNVPLPVLTVQSFTPEKTVQAKKKKLPLKTSPKPGGKKPRKLKSLPKVKGGPGRPVASKISLAETSSADSNDTKKRVKQDFLNPTKLEDNASQVQDRFNLGCECQDSNCFDGLSADSVFRHKLNIAELTKAEHDMYLMGVTMASLGNPDHTNRNKERQRLRAKYVYQGRHVCLQAFLYLENCTLYQVKRIRKHVMTNGVVPRIHGNHGKKPHNRFPLELYCHATEFLKSYLRPFNGDREVSKTTPLRPDVTRKAVHQSYLNYCESHKPDEKVMGYSTFRHFMKEQFPYIRFKQLELPGLGRDISQIQKKNQQPRPQTNFQPKQKITPQVISLTEVVMSNDNKTQIVVENNEDEEVDVVNDSLTENENVVLLNTSVPLMAGSNYVMVTSDAFPQLKETNAPSPSGSGNKTMTINSSSLRLVSANGVSASSLVPMNTLAMLGPGVFPIYLDTEVSPDPSRVTDKAKNEQLVASVKNSDSDSNLRAQSKSS